MIVYEVRLELQTKIFAREEIPVDFLRAVLAEKGSLEAEFGLDMIDDVFAQVTHLSEHRCMYHQHDDNFKSCRDECTIGKDTRSDEIQDRGWTREPLSEASPHTAHPPQVYRSLYRLMLTLRIRRVDRSHRYCVFGATVSHEVRLHIVRIETLSTPVV
jgi:hypothetical protein